MASDIDFLFSKIASMKLGMTGYATMIKRRGLAIAHPKKEVVLKVNFSKQPGMEKLIANMTGQKAGTEAYVMNGVKKIAVYAPIELTGWSVAVAQDWDDLLADAYAIRYADREYDQHSQEEQRVDPADPGGVLGEHGGLRKDRQSRR